MPPHSKGAYQTHHVFRNVNRQIKVCYEAHWPYRTVLAVLLFNPNSLTAWDDLFSLPKEGFISLNLLLGADRSIFTHLRYLLICSVGFQLFIGFLDLCIRLACQIILNHIPLSGLEYTSSSFYIMKRKYCELILHSSLQTLSSTVYSDTKPQGRRQYYHLRLTTYHELTPNKAADKLINKKIQIITIHRYAQTMSIYMGVQRC